MDSTLLAYLVGLAGITITPLAGFGVNLLLKRANEATQKAELAKLGMKGDTLEIGLKNAKIAIYATQQAFRNKPDATNDEKKEFGEGMLKALNKDAKINMGDDTVEALIQAGVWEKNNPVVTPVVPVIPPAPGTTVTTTTTTPSVSPFVAPPFDKSLPPKG
jgi:hypothetical protein